MSLFAEIAVALKIEADHLHSAAQNAETLAARIGLTPAVADRIIEQQRRHAELVGRAHRIFKSLSRFEPIIGLVIKREARR